MNDVPPLAASATRSLDHLRLLQVAGADARTFLDSQLTCNVPPPRVASLAGYCSPKGRLLASFVVWADDDTVSLLLSDDIADAIAKRLRMYVLRAKATIVDASAGHTVCGSVGAAPAAAPLVPWWTATIDQQTWIRLPDVAGQPRHLRIGAADVPGTDLVDGATWRWQDIRSGLPRITLATQDRFVPQMLNLEALGAVDFKKGCFPGQEVVARSQYLGKLKRRMALAVLADGADLPAPGIDVWRSGGDEACGLVVNAERGPDGRGALLVELPVAAFEATDLRIGSVDGPALTIEPLPYALPDNEVFVRPKL